MRLFSVLMRGWGSIVAGAALLTACASGPQISVSGPSETPTAPEPEVSSELPSAPETASPDPLIFAPSGNSDMDRWRRDFAARAMAAGRDREVVYDTLKSIRPLDLYLGLQAKTAGTDVASQAEFAKPIWEYVETAVTEGRKSRGAGRLSELADTFDAIETAYGVDRETLTAIWAMETNLGSYMGNFDAANTLANMAVEGRRRRLGESELLALMKLQEEGEVSRTQLISGWAGAMGQTQFMPSTFLNFAVDFDGDGNKDLWQSAPDALASAANYLSASGYQNNMPWGIEVIAPTGFEWALADGQDRRLSTWMSKGLVPITGDEFSVSENTYAELWLPSGATGPKYLLFKNFDVFKTYNRSDSYALSVGLLSNGVLGIDGPVAVWPTDLQLLSKGQIKTLQASLNRQGFDAGPIDGIAGRGTKGALRRFQASNGIVPADGYPTQLALDQVLASE